MKRRTAWRPWPPLPRPGDPRAGGGCEQRTAGAASSSPCRTCRPSTEGPRITPPAQALAAQIGVSPAFPGRRDDGRRPAQHGLARPLPRLGSGRRAAARSGRAAADGRQSEGPHRRPLLPRAPRSGLSSRRTATARFAGRAARRARGGGGPVARRLLVPTMARCATAARTGRRRGRRYGAARRRGDGAAGAGRSWNRSSRATTPPWSRCRCRAHRATAGPRPREAGRRGPGRDAATGDAVLPTRRASRRFPSKAACAGVFEYSRAARSISAATPSCSRPWGRLVKLSESRRVSGTEYDGSWAAGVR